MTGIYKNLETKLADETWKNRLSEEDVKLVTDSRDVILNLLTQVGVFIDLFHQYVDLIQANAIFAEDYGAEPEQDGNLSPTQTPPAPANRAEKRAAKKSGLILPDTKLVTP